MLLVALAQAACAQALGSLEMLKDARGFGYDIVLYAIAALRIGRGARTERLTTFLIGGLLAASGADAVADLWTSLGRPEEDTAAETLLSDAFALAAPGLAAATLLRFRRAADPLVKASWLNARNDVLAAFLTCASDVVAHATSLRWPGYALDLIGVVLSFQAAAIVLRSALTEPDACGPTALAEGSR
jgi:Co/Zn/Cd efflux system component